MRQTTKRLFNLFNKKSSLEREQSTFYKLSSLGLSKEQLFLPKFSKVSASNRPNLLIQKLELCLTTLHFCDDENNTKTQLLLKLQKKALEDIIRFVVVSNVKKWYSIKVMSTIIEMFFQIVFHSQKSEPEKEFCQCVCNFVIQFILQVRNLNGILNKLITRELLVKLMDALNTVESNKREYVEDIIHIVYAYVEPKRSLIVDVIKNVLFSVTYQQNSHHYGIYALLELCGKIISGCQIPLKRNDKAFLCQVLLPLFKVERIHEFLKELISCLSKFILKDASLSRVIIGAILKFWPHNESQRQVYFLDALSKILSIIDFHTILKFIGPLFKQISRGICSIHFQVSSQALELLQTNTTILNCINVYRRMTFLIMQPFLIKNLNHWNQEVRDKTVETINHLKGLDSYLFEQIWNYKAIQVNIRERNKKEKNREMKWDKISSIARNSLELKIKICSD